MTSAPLSARGRWLALPDGRVVTLRGFNLVNKLPPYAPAALGFDDRHASFLSRNGFNTVRTGIIWTALEPEPGAYDDAYLASIAETVRVCGQHGLVVLLDFHQDMANERYSGEGWPDWALPEGGLPAWPDLGFPLNYAVQPALWRAYDRFWANAPGPGGVGIQDRYAAAWAHVAAALRDEPAIFGYDIFNEPFPGSAAALTLRPGGNRRFDRKLSAFSSRCLEAIRREDERRLVFYEPNVLFDFGVDTHHEALDDPAAGFSFHLYATAAQPGLPSVPGPLQDRLSRPQESRTIRLALRHCEHAVAVPLLSEWGATADTRALRRVAALADGQMLSWQHWAYWNRDVAAERPEECLVYDLAADPAADNLNDEKLAICARPYPRATAGVPARWELDLAAGRWSLEFASEGGRTEISVPPRHFGSGYSVELRRAAVASEPDSPLLEIDSEPGAAVSLTVQAA